MLLVGSHAPTRSVLTTIVGVSWHRGGISWLTVRLLSWDANGPGWDIDIDASWTASNTSSPAT